MQVGKAHSYCWHFLFGCLVVTILSLFCCSIGMAQAQSHDATFDSQRMLTSNDLRWLHNHGKIRMAYISNLLGNCARDPATGELVGSLATYVERAKTCFGNEQLEFAPYAYPTIEAELAALQRGEVDCIFPLYADAKQAEQMGFLVTQSLFNCDVIALSKDKDFDEKSAHTVALAGAKINKRIYLEKHYPHWQIKQYKSDRACVDAVKLGDVHCAIFNSYGIAHIIPASELSGLHSKALAGSMDLALAVHSDNARLHSILDRSVTLVSREALNASMKSFAKPESLTQNTAAKTQGVLWQNKVFLAMSIITVLAVCVILLVLFFSMRNRRTEKRLRQGEKQVEELTRKLQEQQKLKDYFCI